MDEIRITTHTGNAARPFLDEIARLRIAIFREFPYLYEGSLDYATNSFSGYGRFPDRALTGR